VEHRTDSPSSNASPAGGQEWGHSPALAGAAEVVGLVRRLADAQGRDDLASQLDRIRADLAIQPVRVLFVGGPQQGKSSVINALAGAPVCPVGVGVATAAPIELHADAIYRATLVSDGANSAPPTRRDVAFAEAHTLATEAVNQANHWRLRAVVFGVPSATLQRGLCLVDTPPVTAVWKPDTLRLVRTMGAASAVVLVSSASAELTSGEIDLLRVAHGLCQKIFVVVNGTNTFPQWASVVERNQLLLERAGISATVVPVDAAPYWSNEGGLPPGPDPGMATLLHLLDDTVVLEDEQSRISRALTESFWAADRLRMRLLAERSLIGDEAALTTTIGRLRVAAGQAQELCGADATWSRSLSSGIRRLSRDITTDLDAQLAQLRADVRSQLEQGSPDAATVQAWLHDRMALAVVRYQRVRKLSLRAFCDRVAEQFREDWAEIVAALDISPEAHALLYPRLDRPHLTGRSSLADVPLPTATGIASADLRDLCDSWIRATDAYLRDDTAEVLGDVEHALDFRCRYRAGELHRSLVEVLTSLTVLRGVGPDAVEQRQVALASDLAQLTTFAWRMPGESADDLHLHDDPATVDLRRHDS